MHTPVRVASELTTMALTTLSWMLNAFSVQPLKIGGHYIGWQWITLGGFVLFVILVYWHILRLHQILGNRQGYENLLVDIGSLMEYGKAAVAWNPEDEPVDVVTRCFAWNQETLERLRQHQKFSWTDRFEITGTISENPADVTDTQAAVKARLRLLQELREFVTKLVESSTH